MKKIKDKFSLSGMVIVTILLIVGILIMFFVRETPIFIFCSFFIFVGLYCWYGYICNVLIKPKEKTLYLVEVNNNRYVFVDERGKKYIYDSKKKYDVNKFYLVLKTKDYIVKIIDESRFSFEIKEVKDNYWLSCYLPIGNLEGIFLLPVIYVIAFISLSLIFYQNTLNFNCIIMFILAVYLIFYDLIYKLKKKNSISGEVDDSKLKLSFYALINGIKLVTIFIICIILLYLWFSISDTLGKIIFLPFVLCGFSLLCQVIALIRENNKLINFFGKVYIVIFLIYWFGIVLFGIFDSIIKKNYSLILFLMIFVFAGIYMIYVTFFKKK